MMMLTGDVDDVDEMLTGDVDDVDEMLTGGEADDVAGALELSSSKSVGSSVEGRVDVDGC